MRYVGIVLLLLAFVASAQWGGTPPRGKNENNALYNANSFDYDVYQGDVGLCSYTSTVNGAATTIYGWMDWSSTTYDHVELYLEATMSCDATDEDMAATVYLYPSMVCSTWTVADTLNFTNMYIGEDDLGTLRYTVLPDAASIAARHALFTLAPGETKTVPFNIPIWYAGSTAGDSTGTGIGILASDSCEVSYTIIAIPRT